LEGAKGFSLDFLNSFSKNLKKRFTEGQEKKRFWLLRLDLFGKRSFSKREGHKIFAIDSKGGNLTDFLGQREINLREEVIPKAEKFSSCGKHRVRGNNFSFKR